MRAPLHQIEQLITNVGYCIAEYVMALEVILNDLLFWRIPSVLLDALRARSEHCDERAFVDDKLLPPQQSKKFIGVKGQMSDTERGMVHSRMRNAGKVVGGNICR